MNKKNQALVEYLVLIAAIILAVIFAVKGNFSASVKGFFNNAGDTIGKIR